MGEPMRALTVRQPFASAIAFGDKRVENRGKSIAYRGPLAIHAGLAVEWPAVPMAWTAAGLTPYSQGAPRKAWRVSLPLGAVIAVADLAGCHDYAECADGLAEADRGELRWCSPWAWEWQWHWVLRDVRPLREPVPCRGMLGLWRLPEDVEKAVRDQLAAAGQIGGVSIAGPW